MTAYDDETVDANGFYRRWVHDVVERAALTKAADDEAALRDYLISEVRWAMFNSDALWATDVDKLAEIAVGVFTDFARRCAGVSWGIEKP